MRTTLTIEDDILRELRRLAHSRRVSLTRIANETLGAGLARAAAAQAPRRFRQRVFDLGEPMVNLDHALRIAAALEDEETAREMAAEQ